MNRKNWIVVLLSACIIEAPILTSVASGGGSIIAWGFNSDGQTSVPPPNDDFIAVAGGFYHSLGLRADGSIVAWGSNGMGQTSVPAPNSGFIVIAAGAQHSLGLKGDGSIVAWGRNIEGQTSIPAPNSDFIAIAAGNEHSLGLKSDGSIVAWGANNVGQTTVPAPNSDFIAIAAAHSHNLGLKANGSLVAWGDNTFGQTTLPAPNSGFVAVSVGEFHNLGLKADGSIAAGGCVNPFNYGQCDVPAPTGFIALAAGGVHSLGLKADGSIVAWGLNQYDQSSVPAPNRGFIGVAAGLYHSLGLNVTCTPAGDRDSFVPGGPADVIVVRPAFANWFGVNANHFCDGNAPSLPFDTANDDNCAFEYSFLGLVDQVCCPATLQIHLKGSTSPGNDALALVFDDTALPPIFRWSRFLADLESTSLCTQIAGAPDGVWDTDDEMMCLLDLCALPLAGGGTIDLAQHISSIGVLDIYVQDDTGVGYLELCYDVCPCLQPPEACCYRGGTCLDQDPLCCVPSGTPAGPGTMCTAAEECCFPDGSNQVQDPVCCTLAGGTPQGPKSGNVSLPPGACCLPDGSCLVLNPYCCEHLGGSFHGANTLCIGDDNADGIDDACCDDDAVNDVAINLTTGATGAPGGNDGTWSLISEPVPTTGPLPRPAVIIPSNLAWVTIPGSQWISANSGYESSGPGGDYCYETCFCLSETFNNPLLNFSLRADNNAAVFLNNYDCMVNNTADSTNPLWLTSTGIDTFNLATPTVFPQGSPPPLPFLAGLNCIEVLVHNRFTSQGGNTATGFDLSGQFTADHARCCCEPLPTGFGCESVICPNQGERCIPTIVNYDSCEGYTTLECKCVQPNQCHLVPGRSIAGQRPRPPTCMGSCPNPTDACTLESSDSNGDGILEEFCSCGTPHREAGDVNQDGHVDLIDHAIIQNLFSGPGD